MYKIMLDLPKKMVDFAISPSAKEKPYDLCFYCPFIRMSCDGPNILAMDYHRWVEWATKWMDYFDLSKSDVAARANLPLSTVKSALSGKGHSIQAVTMKQITYGIIGGCWGKYPCHLAFLLMNGELHEVDDIDQDFSACLMAERAKLQAQFDDDLKNSRADDRVKINHLLEEITHLRQQLQDAKEESRIRDKYLAQKNERIAKQEDRIDGLHDENAELRRKISDLTEKLVVLEARSK